MLIIYAHVQLMIQKITYYNEIKDTDYNHIYDYIYHSYLK